MMHSHNRSGSGQRTAQGATWSPAAKDWAAVLSVLAKCSASEVIASYSPLSRVSLDLIGVVAVVPAIAIWLFAASSEVFSFSIPTPEPRKLFLVPERLLPPILLPLDFHSLAENVRSRKGADVQA